LDRLVSLAMDMSTLYYTHIWSKSTKSGHNSQIFNSYSNAYAYIRSDRVVNSDPIKFGLVDVLGAQVGQVGQVGELGHGHVLVVKILMFRASKQQKTSIKYMKSKKLEVKTSFMGKIFFFSLKFFPKTLSCVESNSKNIK
jgi:uncharacterized membrane protein YfcA